MPEDTNAVDADLLAILACPLTKKPVVQEGDWLVCREADPPRRYPVRDGVPVMLAEESEILQGEAWRPAEAAEA
jgi:uncharacterized protein YbaR (Trm112 family)